MARFYSLTEKYLQVHEQQNTEVSGEASGLEGLKQKILNLFRTKAGKNGAIRSADGSSFTEPMAAAAIDCCVDLETLKDFEHCLGLGSALTEEYELENSFNNEPAPSDGTVAPERIVEIIKDENYRNGPIDRVVIQSHHGDTPIPVIEAWVHQGTLHLGVDVDV